MVCAGGDGGQLKGCWRRGCEMIEFTGLRPGVALCFGCRQLALQVGNLLFYLILTGFALSGETGVRHFTSRAHSSSFIQAKL